MTKQQLLNEINTIVVSNNIRSITGANMNQVLTDIVNYASDVSGTGGIPGTVPYFDVSGNVTSDPGFTRDPSTMDTYITQPVTINGIPAVMGFGTSVSNGFGGAPSAGLLLISDDQSKQAGVLTGDTSWFTGSPSYHWGNIIVAVEDTYGPQESFFNLNANSISAFRATQSSSTAQGLDLNDSFTQLWTAQSTGGGAFTSSVNLQPNRTQLSTEDDSNNTTVLNVTPTTVGWTSTGAYTGTFTLPNTNGTTGQALLEDGAGNLYWGTVEASLPSGSAYQSLQLQGDGVTPVWSSAFLDNSGITSADYSNRVLYDNGVFQSVDWQNRYLYGNTNTVSIWYGTWTLSDSAQIPSANWDYRFLYDNTNTNTQSIDWGARLLTDTNRATTLSWATAGSLSIEVSNVNINSVGYNFPSLQGSAATVLTNDGAGNLSWGTGGGGGSGWSLTGNSGTSSGTNFIGTTDSQPLLFKVNGNQAGLLQSSGVTFFGVLAGGATYADNCAFGNGALFSNATGSGNVAVGSTALYSATSSLDNVAVGNNSLYSNTGDRNVAIGGEAMVHNSTGGANVAVGFYALAGVGGSPSVDGGSLNVAVGYNAMYHNESGNNNTGVGYTALQNNTTGAQNTAVGSSAGGAITIGTDNVIVGAGSGSTLTTGLQNVVIGRSANVAASNTTGAIALGYNATAASNEFALPSAVTNFKFRGHSYSMPSAYPGSSGQLLSSDTSGNMSWTTPGTLVPHIIVTPYSVGITLASTDTFTTVIFTGVTPAAPVVQLQNVPVGSITTVTDFGGLGGITIQSGGTIVGPGISSANYSIGSGNHSITLQRIDSTHWVVNTLI